MKICIITPYYKPIKGGISNYVLHTFEALIDKKQEVYVIARQGAKDGKAIYLADTNKIFFIIKTFLHIRNLKPDVLHSHSQWYILAPCVLYKYFNSKTVVIHTFHTDPVKSPNKIKCVMLSFLFSQCNVVTFVSKYLQDKIISSFHIKTRMHVVYGGANTNKVEDKDIDVFIKKYSIEENYPIICFIGVLSWKSKADGVKILVKSFNQIVKKFPNSRLIIVGDGTYRKEIESVVEDLGINSKIIFTGLINNPLVPLYVCDIYTHISLQEGFPLAILEAMSCEKPIVASKTGGIPEIINDEENGLLVEAIPEAISNAVINLINSPEKRSNLGRNAKKTIEEKYVWSKIAEDFINLYQIKHDDNKS